MIIILYKEATQKKYICFLLQTFIKTKESEGQKDMANRMVWFSCEGENPADKENLGPISKSQHSTS